MKNKLILILVAAMAAVPLLAQDDESRFNERQADRLNKFATPKSLFWTDVSPLRLGEN